VVADSVKHGLHRDRSGIAEVGRTEDRHRRDDTGILDEIADAHDVAVDDDFRFQRWPLRLGQVGDLRTGGADGHEREKRGDE